MKFMFYISHLLKMAFLNKVRLVLTSIGLFLAVFLYSLCLILTDSYYSANFQENNSMKDNVVMTSSFVSQDEVGKMLETPPNSLCTNVDRIIDDKTIYSSMLEDGRYVNISAYINGVSNLNLLPVKMKNGEFYATNSILCKGRMIDSTDLSNSSKVVVINEMTEQILFNGDGIGKYIKLINGKNGNFFASDTKSESQKSIAFEVIGIVKNSYTDNICSKEIKKKLSISEETIDVLTCVYCPITTVNDNFKDDTMVHYRFYEFENNDATKKFTNVIAECKLYNSTFNNNITYQTKEIINNKINSSLKSLKKILNLISVLLGIISALSVMSITFFSIKERIPEIGIRKAFGATKADIIFQFMLEMLIIAIVSSSIAILTAMYLCYFIQPILWDKFYIIFTIKLTLQSTLLPFLLGVSEAMICGIIPSLYAVNIKVTNSLKFE